MTAARDADTERSPFYGMPLCEHKIQFDCQQCREARPADTVAVRVTDLYEIVRAFYASDDRHTARQQTAADRLHIAMLGVPRLDVIMRQYDGCECVGEARCVDHFLADLDADDPALTDGSQVSENLTDERRTDGV